MGVIGVLLTRYSSVCCILFCTLQLESNGELGSDGAQILVQLLETQTSSIRFLNMESNELGDEGVCILLQPFAAAHNSLEELNLNTNDIGNEGAEYLLQANLPELAVLSLENNGRMDEQFKRKLKDEYGDQVVKVSFGEEEEGEEYDGVDGLS